MGKQDKIDEMIRHLEAEREALDNYGYRFPALFDAVRFLLDEKLTTLRPSSD